jgi:hypothetical protein
MTFGPPSVVAWCTHAGAQLELTQLVGSVWPSYEDELLERVVRDVHGLALVIRCLICEVDAGSIGISFLHVDSGRYIILCVRPGSILLTRVDILIFSQSSRVLYLYRFSILILMNLSRTR